jgi:hypothetical protein
LRSAAVSTANDLPFIPAQPPPASGDVRLAVAELVPAQKPLIIQASAAVATGNALLNLPLQTSNPTPPTTSAAAKTDEEHLPPIVPAWAVPRPGTKKKAPPIPSAAPADSRVQINPSPAPLRIELGATPAPSPAMLPPPPSPPASNKPQPPKTSFQRLPPVEPSLLPSFAKAPQPIALEIRNPHVAQASFEVPVDRPANVSRQHVDDAGAR